MLCQLSDDRAVRLLTAESHQLSRDLMNVLVFDVSRVQAGFDAWPDKIRVSLQPTRNTRFGAVAFYEEWTRTSDPIIRRRWNVVQNPHALKPVPLKFPR